MTTLLRRAVHALTHREEYRAGPNGTVYELCRRRLTGRLIRVKRSEPGNRPNFQPVGGA